MATELPQRSQRCRRCCLLSTLAVSIKFKSRQVPETAWLEVTGSPCGGWDDKTARALSHVAFQPFTWPVLRDTSPSYTDVKVYNGNEILFHWILRGYRADTDLSVQ
eukprot:s2412_g1.t1